MPNLVPELRLDYSLLSIEGADAQSFLQAQLCNDVKALVDTTAPGTPASGLERTQLSGYCNAKGRLFASFLIWQPGPEAFHLLLPQSLAPLLVKRLSMFVLRAKVKLRDTQRAVYGLQAQHVLNEQDLKRQGYLLVEAGRPGASVKTMVSEARRYWLIGPEAQVVPSATGPSEASASEASTSVLGPAGLSLSLPEECRQLSPAQWAEHEVLQGLPWFQAELSEKFVPQTVNLDLLGGVSFTKGCYPGQEVVARSHYLGKLNQRMFLFEGPKGVLPGSDVFLASATCLVEGLDKTTADDGGPIGEIVAAAPRQAMDKACSDQTADKDGAVYLVSLKLEPFRGQSTVLAPQGPRGELVKLMLQPLPYDVPREPQVPNRPKL